MDLDVGGSARVADAVVRCVAAQSSDHEAMFAVGNLAYLAMAVFVAWGRSGPESFTG